MAEQYIPNIGKIDGMMLSKKKLDWIFLIEINNKIDEMTFNEKMEEMLLHLKKRKFKLKNPRNLILLFLLLLLPKKLNAK